MLTMFYAAAISIVTFDLLRWELVQTSQKQTRQEHKNAGRVVSLFVYSRIN